MITSNSSEKRVIADTLYAYAQKYHVPCMSSTTEELLIQQLMTYKPRTCLEIGAAIGRSTHIIADTITPWSGHLWSCEISHPRYHIARHYLDLRGHTSISLYHLDILASDITRWMTDTRDMVFIDGAKHEYTAYTKHITPFLSPHHILIYDDVLAYADKIAPLHRYLAQQQYDISFHPSEPGDALLIAKIGYT